MNNIVTNYARRKKIQCHDKNPAVIPRKCTHGKQVKSELIARPFGLHYNQKIMFKSVRVSSRPLKRFSLHEFIWRENMIKAFLGQYHYSPPRFGLKPSFLNTF